MLYMYDSKILFPLIPINLSRIIGKLYLQSEDFSFVYTYFLNMHFWKPQIGWNAIKLINLIHFRLSTISDSFLLPVWSLQMATTIEWKQLKTYIGCHKKNATPIFLYISVRINDTVLCFKWAVIGCPPVRFAYRQRSER